MDFNQSPYFDDFDEDKQFYKVLFKPGVAVQTREVNQLQSILQNQITKFGNHVFKDGSMVIPGQVNYNSRANFVKIAAINLGIEPLTYLEGKILTTSSTGDDAAVEASVFKVVEATDTDPITLIVLYKSANQDAFGNDETLFLANATLYVKENLTATVTVQGGEGVTGRSAVAAQQAGVYYLGGYFVSVPTTEIVVEKYISNVTAINARIGIAYTEEIITSEMDLSLLDNAAGTANVAAPGADRFKIATTFTSIALTATLENFFELIRVEEGEVQQIINSSQYNILEDTLARRTFDESGNYIVDSFNMEVRESRSNNRGAWNVNSRYEIDDYVSVLTGTTTRYFTCIQAGISGTGTQPEEMSTVDETTSVADGSVRWRYTEEPLSNRGIYDIGTSTTTLGNSSELVLAFGIGKAYIQGYEINKVSNAKLRISKSRDTASQNNRSIPISLGNYALIDPVQTRGMPNVSTGPVALLYDRGIPAGSNSILGYGELMGSARIVYLDSDPTGAYKIGLTAVKMEPGKSFERDVVSIVVPDPASSTTLSAFALSGALKYVGADVTSSYVQISGAVSFTPTFSYSDSSLTDFAGKGSRLSAPWRSFADRYYNASTGLTAKVSASTSITVFGHQSAFTKELRVGDTLTIATSSNATSSWVITGITNDTTMTVSGTAIPENRYLTTSWSSVVNNSPLKTRDGVNNISSITIVASTPVGNSNIFTISAPASAAFSSQLAIGSIIAFCDSSGAITNTSAKFVEPITGVPDAGYTLAQAQARAAAPFTGTGSTANDCSSYMVIGYSTGDDATTSRLQIVGFAAAAFNAGLVAGVSLPATSGIVLLARGTQSQLLSPNLSAPGAGDRTQFSSYIAEFSNGTSAYVRLTSGTIFGIGTGTATRFQSEIARPTTIYVGNTGARSRIVSIATENRMTITAGANATSSLFTSLTLINASTGTLVSNVYGIPYSGTTASFAANVYQNYALGINTRKLDGLVQLLDFNGGTSSATSGTAMRIVGDAAAKFQTDLRSNDLIVIGNNELYVTKISSNSVAFAICLDGTIAGSTTPQSLIRVTNKLYGADKTALVFPVAKALESMVDNNYFVYKTSRLTGLSPGTTSINVTLSGAPGTNLSGETLATTTASYFLVAEDTVGSLSAPITVNSVTYISDTQFRLTLATGIAGTTARVIFPVRHASVDNSLLGGYRTKTLTYDATQEFLSSSSATKSQLVMNQADILRVNKILMATEFVTTWTDGTQATAIDVTSNYNLDNGQTAAFYDLGKLTIRPGRPLPNGSIKIFFDYFEHGSGDYFTIKSYEPFTQIPYGKVPKVAGVNLGDVLDFRTKIDATNNSLINAVVPRYDTTFDTDLTFYLARKEAVVLDRAGKFYNISSSSRLAPETPEVPTDGKALPLYFISLAPYTYDTMSPEVNVDKRDYKRYTMKDIGGIERRVENLEQLTSLNLLESSTKNLQIRDNNNPTLERYKTGIFVDNFTDNSNTDPAFSRAVSIDEQLQELYPRANYNNTVLTEKINFTGAVVSGLELQFMNSARDLDNYRITGDALTLNYTTSTFLRQDLATTSVSVAPFLKAEYLGKLSLYPDTDIFESINSYSTITVNNTNENQLANTIASMRAADRRPIRVLTEESQQVFSRMVNKQVAPFCRANTIVFVATGLKPNSKFYAFFDDTPIGEYLTPALKLTFNEMPTLLFNTMRADPGNWAKWRGRNENKHVQEQYQIPADAGVRGGVLQPNVFTRPRTITETVAQSVRVGGGKNARWETRYVAVQRTITEYFQNVQEKRSFSTRGDAYQLSLPSAGRSEEYMKAFTAGVAVYYYGSGRYLGSAVAMYQKDKTLYLVNQRGQLSPAYIRSGTNVGGKRSRTLDQTFYVAVDQNDPKTLVNTTVDDSQIMGDSSGVLYTDKDGVLVAMFDLPDTDTDKFLCGTKPIMLTTSPINDPDDWDSRVEATYTARGFQFELQTTITNTKTFIPQFYDPLAQSFKIPDQFTNGLFITDVDVFFHTKPLGSERGVPVDFEMRLCDAGGRPGPSPIPGTAQIKFPDEVNADPTGQTPTKFTLRQPLYLAPNINYAIMLRSESVRYRAWVATLGQTDVFNPSRTYSIQALLGSLFKSQEGTLWTEDQLSDMKFVLNRAVFNTNSQAVCRVVNAKRPASGLPVNPFVMTHGSNKIRVRHDNHGHAPGDTVRYTSAYWLAQYAAGNTTATINGIPITELFGTGIDNDIVRDSDAKLTISTTDTIDFDGYVIQTNTVANLGAGAVTGVTSVVAGGNDIMATSNWLYHAITPTAKTLNFSPTTLTFEAEQTAGFTYDGADLPATTGKPYTRSTQALTFNTTNFLTAPKIVLSDVNEFYRAADNQQVAGGQAPTNWKESFTGKFTLTSTDPAVSPLVDLSSLNMQLGQYRIDNPSRDTRLPTTLPAVGTAATGSILNVDYEAVTVNNTTIAFDGIAESLISTTPDLFTSITPGQYIVVSGSSVAGNNSTSTGVRVVDVSQDGTILYLDANFTTQAAGQSISIYQIRDFIDERCLVGSTAASKYVVRRINLENPASSIKLLADANVPSEASFEIYYKVGNANSDLEGQVWNKYLPTLNIVREDDRNIFSEIEIDITDTDAAGNPLDLPEFTAFTIKIVMLTTNGARVPRFKNLRLIAHA